MKVIFFGKLGDQIGREIDLDVPEGCTVSELRALLARRFPDAEGDLATGKVRACVDDIIVTDTFTVQPTARVEFFPPLSGG